MASKELEAAITEHIYTEYSVKPEHPWEKTLDNAVFRHGGNGKWSAVLIKNVKKRSLAIDGERDSGCPELEV